MKQRSPAKRTTLAAIAEEAGVSLATVSKVLNGRADVAPATRARVEQLLGERKYKAQQRGAPTVQLIVHSLDNLWAVEIIRGVESYFTANARPLAVSTMAHHGPAKPPTFTGLLSRQQTAGVILVTSAVTSRQWRQLRESDIPVVVIDPADTPPPDVTSVGATNWSGGISATEHLLELGHRRIAAISGPEVYLCSRARVDGYRHALERSGAGFDPALVRWGNFRYDGGLACALELLRTPDPPTAIFAGSDQQALGVYEAVRHLGLSLPTDVSVVGFDDVQIAQWIAPPLTTVRQPLAEMGRLAAEMLGRMMDGQPGISQRVELATELVVRASTAAPPRRARR